MWWDAGAPTDSFYQVRPECTDVPKTKFRIKAGKTLSARKWQTAFTPEGYLDIARTLSRIRRGGIHPSIRGEVWEFLLGCYDPKSTFDEREQIRQHRREKYALLKEECRQMFPLIGSGRFITAPVVTEDGEPVQDPVVLKELGLLPEENGNADNFELSTGSVVYADAFNSAISGASGGSEMVKEPSGHGPQDKKVIQWKLTLHQIGWYFM
ncbi:unnamed protein product [Ilex paraguariensis]|uniref:Rab-GAP TBC domain-containing protein n=1 Tax=Ilex paraguariensis TaxID=185542 RepID=A0ABC8UZ79_9AQUA